MSRPGGGADAQPGSPAGDPASAAEAYAQALNRLQLRCADSALLKDEFFHVTQLDWSIKCVPVPLNALTCSMPLTWSAVIRCLAAVMVPADPWRSVEGCSSGAHDCRLRAARRSPASSPTRPTRHSQLHHHPCASAGRRFPDTEAKADLQTIQRNRYYSVLPYDYNRCVLSWPEATWAFRACRQPSMRAAKLRAAGKRAAKLHAGSVYPD